jgi:hypothetical protein
MDEAFNRTTHLLFGQKICEFKDFEPYLKEAMVGKSVSSFFSGKPLWVACEQYAEGARFFDYATEHDKLKDVYSKPLDIDEIKDIDSLFDAVGERLIYSGNKALGNSNYVENSDSIVDSNYVVNSSILTRSKFCAYAYLMRESEYVFGSTSSGDSSYIMRCFYNNTLKRCFECCTTVKSSDCYFTYNLIGCNEALFSFNLRNKRNVIGNIELDKEAYADLKKKLVSELADELKRNKRLDFSIIDLFQS